MNILMVTESFPPHAGGSGWSTLQLCKGLQEKKHNVLVAHLNGKTHTYEGISVIGIPLGFWSRFFWKRTRKAVQELVDAHHIDIVHAQHVLSSLAIKKVKRAKKVVTLRDYWPVSCTGTLFNNARSSVHPIGWQHDFKSFFDNRSFLHLLVFPFLRYQLKKARVSLAQSDGLIAVSAFVKSLLTPFLHHPIEVINNLIDLTSLQTIPATSYPKNTIVFVGKLEKPKGIHHLLAAVKDIDVELTIIGEGTLRTHLEKQAQQQGTVVHFLEYVDNTTALSHIKGATLFVVPSLWHEPLGRTLLEGLGVGATIIAAHTGGTQEIITHEKEGLLYDGSVAALRSCIQTLLADPAQRKQFSTQAQIKAKRFDRTTGMKRFEDFYVSLQKS